MTRMLLQSAAKFLLLIGGAFAAFLVIQVIARLLWGKDKGDAVAFWVWLVGCGVVYAALGGAPSDLDPRGR